MTIDIPNNKVNHKMYLCMLKCARGSITNQDRREINNSDWLQEGGCVVSYWGVCCQLLGGVSSVTGECICSQKGCVYRRSLYILECFL